MSPTTQTAADVLRGGRNIEVTFADPESTAETVFVREVSVQDVLEGKYIDLLRTDYAALLDWLTGKPEGWAKSLDRASWTRLRETEEALNFEFALAETKAAHERGQKTRFINEALLQQTQTLLETMDSLGLSPNTAGQRGPAKKRPVENR